jgi:VIT1/CCC1 family predicted Fe2+/Mn2+ transporter
LFERQCFFFFSPSLSFVDQFTLLFTEAWHGITSTDALADSGEESGDEYIRADYGTLHLSTLLQGLLMIIEINISSTVESDQQIISPAMGK